MVVSERSQQFWRILLEQERKSSEIVIRDYAGENGGKVYQRTTMWQLARVFKVNFSNGGMNWFAVR